MTAIALDEFHRQVDTLIRLGYAEAAGLPAEAFRDLLAPLEARVTGLGPLPQLEEGRAPFVIVVRGDLVPLDAAMARTRLKDHAGFIDFKPGGLETFRPLDILEAPDEPVYLVFDLDTGAEFRNVTPDDALEVIRDRRRTPLTLEEGIALITQFPATLRKNHCFSLAGSRCGDRRVPALWISKASPKLGWCWAGNPHTWLGTASAGGRAGRVR